MTITQRTTTAQENRPLLSIVTVVWNDPAGLDKTFQSLSNLFGPGAESGPSIEHVVVDSSPDKHGEIFAKLAELYPLVRIASGKNGIYAAMNEGARAARGDLVWFLNAGDTLVNSPRLLSSLGLIAAGGRQILGGPVFVGGGEGDVIVRCPGLVRGTFGKNRICHQAVVYPRELLREFNFYDLRFPIAADFHLHLRMLLKGVTMIEYSEAFARFELGGVSSKIIPALREFSSIQKELNRGRLDSLFRQLALVKEACLIAFSKVVKMALGAKIHHSLKKLGNRFK